MYYHINEIEKGEYGKTSKILEEMQEFCDSLRQDAYIMAWQELSDLYGAFVGVWPGSVSLLWAEGGSQAVNYMSLLFKSSSFKHNPTKETAAEFFGMGYRFLKGVGELEMWDVERMSGITKRVFEGGHR